MILSKTMQCADVMVATLRQNGGKAILNFEDMTKTASVSFTPFQKATKRLMAAGVISIEGGKIKRGSKAKNIFQLTESFLSESKNWVEAFEGVQTQLRTLQPDKTSPISFGRKPRQKTEKTEKSGELSKSIIQEVVEVYNLNTVL